MNLRNKDENHVENEALEEPLLETTSQSNGVQNDQQQRLVDGMPFWTSVLLKSLFFLQALSSSAWGRFATIYYNLHGLNSQQIGLLDGLMPAVRTVAQPFWGIVADRYQCRKTVYLGTKVAGTSLLLMMAFPFVYKSYTRILIVSLSTMLFASSGILDAYTLDLLGDEHKLRYGRYRMCSAISWGIGAVLMGFITDHYGFEPNFVIYGVLAAVSACLIAWRIPNVVHDDEQPGETGKVKDLLLLVMRPRVVVFIVENIVIGAGMGTVERLLFLYLVNDLGASTLLCGLSVGVNVLIELPIFWYATHVMAVLGHDGMFAVSMSCFVVRVFGYTWLTPSTRWFILPLEALHGVTFACFWVATVDVAKVLIEQTKGWQTTIPTAVQTLYGALGVGLGSIVGGWAMHDYGSRDMYRGMATIISVTLVLHLMGSAISRVVFGQSLLPSRKEAENSDDHDLEHEPFMDSTENSSKESDIDATTMPYMPLEEDNT